MLKTADYEVRERELRGWMWTLAKRYSQSPRLDPDDLYQEACIVLAEAVETWTERGDDFTRLFKTVCAHRLIDVIRYHRSPLRDVRHTVSGDFSSDDHSSLFERTGGVALEPLLELVQQETMQRLFSLLSPDEQALLKEFTEPSETFQQLFQEYEKKYTRVWRDRPTVWLYGRALNWRYAKTKIVWASLKNKVSKFFEEDQPRRHCKQCGAVIETGEYCSEDCQDLANRNNN